MEESSNFQVEQNHYGGELLSSLDEFAFSTTDSKDDVGSIRQSDQNDFAKTVAPVLLDDRKRCDRKLRNAAHITLEKTSGTPSCTAVDTDHALNDILNDSGGPGPPMWRQQLRAIIGVQAQGTVEEFHRFLCDLFEHGDSNEAQFLGLCAAMLSAQTRDAATLSAVRCLAKTVGTTCSEGHGLSPRDVAIAPAHIVEGCLQRVNYYKRKARHLQELARVVLQDWDGMVPKRFEDLVQLPGVGPKVANLVCAVIFGKVEGCGMIVDTHVHRISQRLGWTTCKETQPEQTRRTLETFIPYSIREITTRRLIGFGQEICLPRKPRCGQCCLAASSLCPSASDTSHIEDLAVRCPDSAHERGTKRQRFIGLVCDRLGTTPQIELD